MTVATPIATECTTPARRGRQAAAETLPQQVEGRLYGISAELTHARANVEATAPHDALADRAVELIAEIARRLNAGGDKEARYAARLILAACAEYRRHDEQEDAQVALAGRRIEAAHTEARVGASLIEQHETGKARGRAARRATRATQEALI